MLPLPFSRKEQQYLPITPDDDIVQTKKAKSSSFSSASFWLLWIVLPCALLSNLYLLKRLHDNEIPNAVFSPAASAVKYKNVVAVGGLAREDLSPYMGPPSDENDELWSKLYNGGMSRLPLSDAKKMANKTVPIPNDPGYYVATLDVFHQLHCLNMIRKRIWVEGEPPEFGPQGIVHMDHCIESIRQSLMCSSDITPRPYAWNEEQQTVLPVNQVIRTCRDFEALRDWSWGHRASDFNLSIHLEAPELDN